MEGNGPLVTVTNAGVSIVVGQIFYYELLSYIDCLMDVLCCHVYQLDRKLTATHSQHLRLLVKAKSSNSTSIVIDLYPLFHLSHLVNLPYSKV